MSDGRDFRLRAAERHGARAANLAQRVQAAQVRGPTRARLARATATGRLAADRAGLLTRHLLHRGVDAARQWWDRLRTPRAATTADDGDEFWVVAHRGSSARKPENTLAAMRYAVEVEHANALEIDLSFTADGEVVLWHDWLPGDTVALARQLGLESSQKYMPSVPPPWSAHRRPTHELTLAELRQHFGYRRRVLLWFSKRVDARIPTLREFLEWAVAADHLRAVFLDIKLPADQLALAPAFTRELCRLLDEFSPRFEAILMTPRREVFEAMRPHAAGRTFSLDVEVPPGIVLDATAHSGMRAAIEALNPYASVGRPALTFGAWRIYQQIIEHDVALRTAHNRDHGDTPVRRLVGWTINRPAEYRRLLELGVGAILTDKPRKLRRAAARLGRRLA